MRFRKNRLTNPKNSLPGKMQKKTSLHKARLFGIGFFHAAHAEESAPSSIRGERQSYSRSAGCEWITYPGLFDAVTDVELSMTSTGIKENIIVNRYTGNHVYAYQMAT